MVRVDGSTKSADGADNTSLGGGGAGGRAGGSTDRAGGNGGNGRVIITYTQPATLSAGTLTAFGSQCLNTTTGPNSFTLTGINLTADDITIGPLNGFTFSTTSGGTYSGTLILNAPGNPDLTIYVKFTPIAIQSYNGNIPVSGGGAVSINVAASGSGVNDLPPAVTSPTSATITSNSAILGGNITSEGCTAVTERGIYWSTTNGFANGTGTKVSETGSFSTGTVYDTSFRAFSKYCLLL